MIKTRHVKWLLTVFCVVQGAINSFGQTTPAVKHRWSHLNIQTSDELSRKYVNLPEAGYTPPNSLDNWSSKEGLLAYAAKEGRRSEMQLVLLVDDKGVIKEAEIIKADEPRHADAVKALLLGSKTGGASFVQNKAVVCYVPCTIKLTGREVTIQ